MFEAIYKKKTLKKTDLLLFIDIKKKKKLFKKNSEKLKTEPTVSQTLNFLNYVKIFFVSTFISSTEGWSKGLISKALPNKIVSRTKKQNNSPIDSSDLFKTVNDLKGNFFIRKILSVAILCASIICERFLFFKYILDFAIFC